MKLEKTDFIEKYVQYCIEMEKAMKKMKGLNFWKLSFKKQNINLI